MQRYDLVVGTRRRRRSTRCRRDRRGAAPIVAARSSWSAGGAGGRRPRRRVPRRQRQRQLDAVDVDSDGDGSRDDTSSATWTSQADGTFRGQVRRRGQPPAPGRGQECWAGRRSVPVADNRHAHHPVAREGRLPDPRRRHEHADPRPLLVRRRSPGVPRQARVRDLRPLARRGHAASTRSAARPSISATAPTPPLYLPAGGTYRIYASRGTEWSIASQPVTGTADVDLTFTLKHVVPTPGYFATDWHVHQVGSPDSPVLADERVRQRGRRRHRDVRGHRPRLRLRPAAARRAARPRRACCASCPASRSRRSRTVTSTAGRSSPTRRSANRGAIDWARGAALGFAMTPGEIYDAMRARGAPDGPGQPPARLAASPSSRPRSRARTSSTTTPTASIFGDYENASTPNDWLRLPGESLWSDKFNGLEVWNGFTIADSNGDGLRENQVARSRDARLVQHAVARLLRDAGRQQRHPHARSPIRSGMPRTYVRVADDSPPP